jgi:hypothetical protein
MVVKSDGERPSKDAVRDALALRRKRGPRWDGTVKSGARGRPRQTTVAIDKKIRGLVFKHRGKALVNRAFILKTLKAARKLSPATISRRLADAGLAWLRQTRKTLVLKQHKLGRTTFGNWILGRKADTLERWVYVDGTTWFLAKGWDQLDQKQRAALGPHVWRMADGSDGLFEDCVGPSSYAKAQGTAVRIWGMLANGRLYVTVLPPIKDGERGGGMTIVKYVGASRGTSRTGSRTRSGRGARPISSRTTSGASGTS